MAKKQVIVTHANYDSKEFVYNQTTYPDDHDAQLHTSGALIVVEMMPDLLSPEKGAKKADLVAIYNSNEWSKVEIK